MQCIVTYATAKC